MIILVRSPKMPIISSQISILIGDFVLIDDKMMSCPNSQPIKYYILSYATKTHVTDGRLGFLFNIKI